MAALYKRGGAASRVTARSIYAGMAERVSIRYMQRSALADGLRLSRGVAEHTTRSGKGVGAGSTWDSVVDEYGLDWKVVVYDDASRDILSSLFSVRELRKGGVTLCLSLGDHRESMPDIPAHYLLDPANEESIDRFVSDLQQHLYAHFVVHFLGDGKASNGVDYLAQQVADRVRDATLIDAVRDVCDYPVEFITMDPNLVTFRIDEYVSWRVFCFFVCFFVLRMCGGHDVRLWRPMVDGGVPAPFAAVED